MWGRMVSCRGLVIRLVLDPEFLTGRLPIGHKLPTHDEPNDHGCEARLPWRFRLAAYFVIPAVVAFCCLVARPPPRYDQRTECLDFYGRTRYAKRQVHVSRDGFVFLVESQDGKVNDVVGGDCRVTSDQN